MGASRNAAPTESSYSVRYTSVTRVAVGITASRDRGRPATSPGTPPPSSPSTDTSNQVQRNRQPLSLWGPTRWRGTPRARSHLEHSTVRQHRFVHGTKQHCEIGACHDLFFAYHLAIVPSIATPFVPPQLRWLRTEDAGPGRHPPRIKGQMAWLQGRR